MWWRADLPDKTSCWFSTARPITVAATLPFPATSRSCIFRPIHRNSIRRKISGMKFVKKYSRTMHSNPWTPCAPSSSRPSSTSNAIQRLSDPLRHFPTSATHSDVELVLELDPSSNFDQGIGGYSEAVDCMGGVSGHESEERKATTREHVSIFAAYGIVTL